MCGNVRKSMGCIHGPTHHTRAPRTSEIFRNSPIGCHSAFGDATHEVKDRLEKVSIFLWDRASCHCTKIGNICDSFLTLNPSRIVSRGTGNQRGGDSSCPHLKSLPRIINPKKGVNQFPHHRGGKGGGFHKIRDKGGGYAERTLDLTCPVFRVNFSDNELVLRQLKKSKT